MNKKLIFIFVLFSFSLLVIAGCQEPKGIIVSNKAAATAEKTMEGKPIVQADSNYVSCELNKECFLNLIGRYTLIDNKKITLVNVGSSGDVAVRVDGVSKILSSGQKSTINGITVQNIEQFYDSENNADSSANLIFSYVNTTSPINNTNTVGSGMEEIRLRSNGEYRFLDGGAIKISCNSVRGSKPAFVNNTRFLANGSLTSGAFAEHNLIPGEYTTAFNKKYSCNR